MVPEAKEKGDNGLPRCLAHSPSQSTLPFVMQVAGRGAAIAHFAAKTCNHFPHLRARVSAALRGHRVRQSRYLKGLVGRAAPVIHAIRSEWSGPRASWTDIYHSAPR